MHHKADLVPLSPRVLSNPMVLHLYLALPYKIKLVYLIKPIQVIKSRGNEIDKKEMRETKRALTCINYLTHCTCFLVRNNWSKTMTHNYADFTVGFLDTPVMVPFVASFAAYH